MSCADGKPAGDTPRKVVRWSTDTIHTADHGGFVAYDDYLTLENELRAARAELSELQELTRMQMAGISVAALMNSRQSDPPLHKEHPYWTPAYQDTLDAVIREMAHREESERLLAELEACRADAERYRWLRDVHSHHFFVTRHVGSTVLAKFYGQTLDAAIDAAREG